MAAHILEQVLAMDQGSLKVQLAALKPANNPHPFDAIDALPDYKDNTPALVPAATAAATTTNRTPEHDSSAEPQMSQGGAKPDIKAEADDQGRVAGAAQRARQSKNQPGPRSRTAAAFSIAFSIRGANPPRPRSRPAAGLISCHFETTSPLISMLSFSSSPPGLPAWRRFGAGRETRFWILI